MNSRKRPRTILSTAKLSRFFALSLIVMLTGCGATTSQQVKSIVPQEKLQSYLADKPQELHGLYETVLTEGKRNQVKNLVQSGIAAFELGQYELAAKSLDQALVSIESIYAADEAATKARSLWHEEGGKEFKGEPYERAMTYYYRGLLYLVAGDYENARACFKSGVIQDAFAEEQQYQCDFALLYFLEGWCSQMLGDHSLAKEAYAEVKKLRPDFSEPSENDNILAVVETGTSPRKVADGVGHAELKYRRGKHFDEKRAWLQTNDQPALAYPMEDIFYQAATRGGRGIDKILEGQAVFLQKGMEIGSALTQISTSVTLASTLMSNSGNLGEIGVVVGGVGGVATLIAINAKPHADTRYLNNLPDIVHIMTFAGQNKQDVNIVFSKDDEYPLDAQQKLSHVHFDQHGNGLLWVRSRAAM